MANKYNPFLIICGVCNKERKDSRAKTIEGAIGKAIKEGWNKNEHMGLICPKCKELMTY